MQKFSLQQLPELSEEFLMQLRRLFKIFEIKSTGLAYFSQLEIEMPHGIPGLPLRTLYLLNNLTKSKNGMFTFNDLVFCVRLLKLRNMDEKILENIIGRIKSNIESINPMFTPSSPELNNGKSIPKPPLRLSQINCRSTNNLNTYDVVHRGQNQYRFARSKSLQDMEFRENLANQQNSARSCRNSQIELHNQQSEPSYRINQLINENHRLCKDVVSLRKELDYYKKLITENRRDPNEFPDNLFSKNKKSKSNQIYHENNFNSKQLITQF